MKRIVGALLGALVLAATVNAQITGGDRNSLSNRLATLEAGAGAGGTVTGCTSRFILASAASLLGCDAAFVADASGSGNGAYSFKKTTTTAGGDNLTANFVTFSGLMTVPTSGLVRTGVKLYYETPAGTADNIYFGFNSQLSGTYAGTSATTAVRGINTAPGTGPAVFGFDYAGATGGNYGVLGRYTGTTTGVGVGVMGQAQGSNYNVAVGGSANIPKDSVPNVGGVFVALNTGTGGIQTGVYAGLHAANNPVLSDAAGIFNNGATTLPMLKAQDNGTDIFVIQDGGSLWSKSGTKTLVSATPTAFTRVAVPNNGRQGGIVEYCVDANDATNYQTRCGSVSFALVNENGTEAGAVGTPADADGTPTGTLTVSFSVANTAADTMDIRASADSSLGETTLRIAYTVRLFGNAATVVTAQ